MNEVQIMIESSGPNASHTEILTTDGQKINGITRVEFVGDANAKDGMHEIKLYVKAAKTNLIGILKEVVFVDKDGNYVDTYTIENNLISKQNAN